MTKPSIESYRFCASHRVYVPPGPPEANREELPAPDTPEGGLLAILRSAADLSHGSEELLGLISDDFTRLQLSPERANFLQPFRELLRGHVLAIGSSIGPVARFLADCGADLHAVEPDFTQAALTAARCRDLERVRVYVADPAGGFPGANLYDVIVATAPAGPSVPVESYLDGLRRALGPGGLLIIAANNSLGMSSIAGASVRRLTAGGGWQLSKTAIDEVFAPAGFKHVLFFGSFPDCDFSRLMVGPGWSAKLPDGLETILSAYDGCGPPGAGGLGRETLWKLILDNGLLAHLSNSFIIAASLKPLPATFGSERLRVYSTRRRKHFAKASIFREERGELAVSRRPLFSGIEPPPNSLFRLRSYQEPYFAGTSYLSGLQQILNREAWQPEEIVAWARPWLDLLNAKASDETFLGYIGGQARLRVLPPIYVDCIPANIRVSTKGELFPIDFEYEAVAPIPLKFVVFRGLYQALSAVSAASPPETAFGNIADLVLEIMRLACVPLDEYELRNCIRIEAALQDSVAATPISATEGGLRTSRLRVNLVSPALPASSPTGVDALQLFWKTADSEYRESASAGAPIFPGHGRQTVSVVIPPIDPPPDSLRLDPCTRPGVFYLYALRLFDALGECVWAWDGDRARFVEKRFLTFADTSFESGMIVYSEGADPSLIVPARPEVLRRLGAGGRLEAEMSWPEIPDHLVISRRIQDADGYREQIRSLEAESRALAQARDNEAALHAEIRDRYDLAAAELAQARSQHAELAETQQRLTAEASEYKRELTSLEPEYRALREENERLATAAGRLAQAQAENAGLPEAQQRLTAEASGYKRELTSLEREYRALREENERLATAAGRLVQAQAENAGLTEAQQRLTAEASEYKRELRSLEREYRALREENERLTAAAGKLAQAQAENAELTEAQQRLAAEASGYKRELTSLEREYRALREEKERLTAAAGKLAQAQAENAELTEAQQRLAAEASEHKSELASLEREYRALREEKERLTTEAGSLRSNSDRTLASANSLNRELQEQVRIMKEELRNVSNERYALQRDNRILAAQIRRIDQLEQRLTEMYESRIWRILVRLSSPFNALLAGRKK